MHDTVGPGRRSYRHEGAERNHVAGGVAGLQARDVLGVQPEARLGLRIHLVSAAEAVEVIDVQGAEIDLHGVEDVRKRDALGLRLLAIHLGVHLRHVDLVAAEQPRKLRRFAALGEEIVGLPRELLEARGCCDPRSAA